MLCSHCIPVKVFYFRKEILVILIFRVIFFSHQLHGQNIYDPGAVTIISNPLDLNTCEDLWRLVYSKYRILSQYLIQLSPVFSLCLSKIP